MKYQFYKRGGALWPVQERDKEQLKRLKHGAVVVGDFVGDRVPEHHRKFFALVRLLFENSDQFATEERLRKYLMVASGHCDEWYDHNGHVNYEPKSIAWHRMDESEFLAVWDDCIQAAIKYVLPANTPLEIQLEVMRMGPNG